MNGEVEKQNGHLGHDQPKRSIVIRTLQSITIEPMLFLQLFAGNLITVLTSNLYIDRICQITLNYTEDVCRAYSRRASTDGLKVEKDPAIETTIQIHVSTLMIYENIIEFGPVVIFALFLGSWCDRYGTKKPMVYSICGSLLHSLILMAITYFPSLRPEFIFLAFVPLGLSGGELARNVTAYSYMSRITNEKNRSFRLITLQVFWFLGLPAGMLIGPKIYSRADFSTVFLISSVIYTLAVLYGLFFIKDDIPQTTDKESESEQKVISFTAVKDMVTVIFKKREGLLRTWIILLWLLMVFRILINTSRSNLTYLYTRKQLGWDAQSFTEFRSIQAFVSIPGNLIVAYIALKIFKLKDQVVGLYCSIGYIVTSFIFAFATNGWMMYLGAAIGMVCGLQLSITRSILSKIIQSNEISKALCFISLTDAALQIPFGTLFNIFYNHTVAIWAGSFYFLHVLIFTCMACVFGYLLRSMEQGAKTEGDTEL